LAARQRPIAAFAARYQNGTHERAAKLPLDERLALYILEGSATLFVDLDEAQADRPLRSSTGLSWPA
jgi:hypothetical protein